MENLQIIDYLYLLLFITLVNWAAATIIFRRVTVRYIDQKLKEEEDDSADWDRGMRIIWYSMAIVAKKAQERSFVNEELVKKHARNIDTKLAWYHSISSMIMFSLMLIMYFFFDIDAD